MANYSRSALTLLLVPGLVQAQAPAPAATFSQRFRAGSPEVQKLMSACEFRAAFTLAQGLLPESKPLFDKTSVNGVRSSCWNFIEAIQAYRLAYYAAFNAGEWEKAVSLMDKAGELARENRDLSQPPLTEQMEYYKGKAQALRHLQEQNADAIKELKAKATLESYEGERMETVKAWEKDTAEFEKWGNVFQSDLKRSAWEVENLEKLSKGSADSPSMATRIKDQEKEIENYKAKAGSDKRLAWVEGVISSKTYLNAFPDRSDKVSFLCRLLVLAPENKKVARELEVQMGKAKRN